MSKGDLKEKRWIWCIFPGYRWCGPGCSGPGEPTNDVDGCCKSHDICYSQDSKCSCDRQLLGCLRPKINVRSKKGIIAGIMFIYFRFQILFTCTFFRRK